MKSERIAVERMVAAKLDEEKIKRQAKAIMDEFVKALYEGGYIYGGYMPEPEEATRKGKKKKSDKDFIGRILKNAPKSVEGQILAEKKNW